jgi:signal transduction histidine kinase
VIDISKIEAGFLQVYVEKFDLIALLTEVQHAVQHLAEEKELALIIDCPPEIKLETDRKRLYQVVLNVVSNGLKYSEQGAVKVTASIKAKKLLIVVEDTGIGISEENLVDLFKPFVRVDSHLKIKTLGTGLGLYLTRKILSQLLCGEISVTSQLGLGSLFTVSLPIKIPKVTMQNQTSVLEDLLP